MKKCKGLLGFLFGHSYKSVYETDEEYYNAEEKVAIMKQEFWSASLWDREKGTTARQPKRITSILKGHLCSRCGDFIKDENIQL